MDVNTLPSMDMDMLASTNIIAITVIKNKLVFKIQINDNRNFQ